MLAALSDKIRIYTILMDDIREVRDFHIRGCKECVFSNGGHLLAAGNGNVVQIYTTTSYENTHNLKGHNNKVLYCSPVHPMRRTLNSQLRFYIHFQIRRLKWSVDDTKLISVGSDAQLAMKVSAIYILCGHPEFMSKLDRVDLNFIAGI